MYCKYLTVQCINTVNLCVQCTVHSKPLTVECTVFSVQCIVYIVPCTLCVIQCTRCIVQYTVCIVQCTVFIVQCTVCVVQCTVCGIKYTVYRIHCTVYSVLDAGRKILFVILDLADPVADPVKHILNFKGYHNSVLGSKVTAVLQNWCILPTGGVALERVRACILRSRIVE